MSRSHRAARPARLALQTAVLAGLLALGAASPALAQTIRVISHRQPALELYTNKMKAALPTGEVDVSLMPIDKELELASITMSAGSDAIDVVYLNDGALKRFAKNGWLEPLDDLWAKYKQEFNLDDFPPSVIESVSYNGRIYAIPVLTNTELFFYRKDLFAEKGIAPPKSFDEYMKAAQAFHSGRMAGTIMSLKPVDAALNETHWYMNAIGPGWFDDKLKPIFNGPEGVKAVETLKAMSKLAPRGFTAHANDESTINLQQGLAAMGLQWVTRASSMDDPQKSRVVGKIDWVAPPGGGARMANDGYAISKFSSKDKDKIFRMIATAANQQNMREAAEFVLPPRRSLLNDPELRAKYRWYPAAQAALESGKPFPQIPDFLDVGEIVTRRVLQAVTGEMDTKAALDAAAKESEELLASRGYYKEAAAR